MEYFQFIKLNFYFLPKPTENSWFHHDTEEITDGAIFNRLEYKDGRLKGSLTYEVNEITQTVVGNPLVNCIECYCSYKGFSFPISVEFDFMVPKNKF